MKKKQSKTDYLRSLGVTEPYVLKMGFKGLRYRNPPAKGVYWHFFSSFVRQRDIEKWGTCISCGRPITMENSDAGHFMPASNCGRDLLFDPLNVNTECKSCNGFDEAHLLGYADNLDKRYGKGTALELRNRRQAYKDCKTPVKDFTAKEYEEKIKSLPNVVKYPK